MTPAEHRLEDLLERVKLLEKLLMMVDERLTAIESAWKAKH